MVGTSENIGNYKQRTVRVTPLLVCIWDCICNGSKRCYRGNGGTEHCTTGRCIYWGFYKWRKAVPAKNPGSAGKEKIYNLPAGISRNRQDPIGETDGRTIWQCVDHKSYYGCPGYKRCNSIPPFAFHRRFAYRWIWSGWNKWD